MTEQEILDEWEKDTAIAPGDYATAARSTPYLHHKYIKELSYCKARLFNANEDFKKIKLIKTEYYNGKLDDETIKERGYKPLTKLILKEHIASYLEADQELRSAREKLYVQESKKELLDSIIKLIMIRNYSIKTALDAEKFYNGVG